MKRPLKAILLIGLYVLGVTILLLTNPQHLPIIILVVPFIIFFVALFVTIRFSMEYFRKKDTIVAKRKTMLAAIIAAFPLACLSLQSVGQLSVRDFITLLVLFAVLAFYVNRSSSTS